MGFLASFLIRHLTNFFSILIGLVYLFLLPTPLFISDRGISENALMPDYASTSNIRYPINMDLLQQEMRLFSNYDMINRFLNDRNVLKFRELKWWNDRLFHGTMLNNHSDGSESILLVFYLEREAGKKRLYSLKFIFSLLEIITRVKWWARDITLIFIEEKDKEWNGNLSRWLSEHVESGMQSAVVIDLISSVPRPAMIYEGLNGIMPNLDIPNMIARFTRQRYLGLEPELDKVTFKIPNAKNHLSTYFYRLRNITKKLWRQAFGVTGAFHSPFLKYQIDSLTFQLIPVLLEGTSEGEKDKMGSEGKRASEEEEERFYTVVSIVETTLRSLNNLLEKFHQSIFFYLITDSDGVISVNNFLPAIIAIVIGLVLSSLIQLSIQVKRMNWNSFGCILLTISGVYLFSSSIFALSKDSRLIMFALDFVQRSLIYVIINKFDEKEKSILRNISICAWAIGLLVLNMMNFGLAVVSTIIVIPLLYFSGGKPINWLLLYLFNPLLIFISCGAPIGDLSWNMYVPFALLYPFSMILHSF